MPPIKREEIIKKTQDLARLISDQEEIQLFQKAEKKINEHKRIQQLITDIKRKQQELVNAKHIKKPNYIKKVEQELDLLNKELHSIPLVYQYQQYQVELNKYLHTIIRLIKDEVSKEIPLDDEPKKAKMDEIL